MSIWSGSSHGTRQINSDGTRNVHCYQCKAFISRSFTISKALCALCQAVEDHKILTPQQLRDYHLAKAQAGGAYDVSLLNISDEIPELGARKFSFRSLGGEIMRAIGIKKPAVPPVPSAVLANSKRRGRLLENIDLQSLGSMKQVDGVLKKKT